MTDRQRIAELELYIRRLLKERDALKRRIEVVEGALLDTVKGRESGLGRNRTA